MELNQLPIIKNGRPFRTVLTITQTGVKLPQLVTLTGYDDTGLTFSNGAYVGYDKFEYVDYGRYFVKLMGYGMTMEFTADWYDCQQITAYAIINGLCNLKTGL